MREPSVLCVGVESDVPELIGGAVTTVETKAAAIDHLDAASCVVTAAELPDGDGLELLVLARERRPSTSVVLVPDTVDSDLASRAVDADVTALLPRDVPSFEERFRRRVEDIVSAGPDRRESLYAGIVDGIGVGVAVYGPDGTFRYVNPTYASMLDRDRESLAGTPVWEVNPAIDPERFERYWDSLSDGGTRRAETTHRRADGTELPVETHTTAISVGDRCYHVGTITDIRERLADRRALERQNERLERFASAISHDLRNPLDVAMGRTNVLAEECESEHLASISRALDRMDELITDVLTLAREGEQIEDPERVDLETVVETAWETAGVADATLRTESLGPIEADASRLRQLLENLFRNAMEHGRTDDGPITVTVGRVEDADTSGFYVADDGVGFGDTDPDQLFEHGFSTSESGTGFGLAIVQTIAEAHGWRVRARPDVAPGARIDVVDVEWV